MSRFATEHHNLDAYADAFVPDQVLDGFAVVCDRAEELFGRREANSQWYAQIREYRAHTQQVA